jgi:dTDP-4-dehydrorhamnose 3,5-epimerase
LSDTAEFVYKLTDFYHPEDQDGIMWNDSDLNILWPINDIQEVVLSDKDKKLTAFREYIAGL